MNNFNETELRKFCLQIASNNNATDVVAEAERIYNWMAEARVKQPPKAPTPPEAENPVD